MFALWKTAHIPRIQNPNLDYQLQCSYLHAQDLHLYPPVQLPAHVTHFKYAFQYSKRHQDPDVSKRGQRS